MTSWFIGPDPSWRSMTTEICRKKTRFSCLFASIISLTSTKHIYRPARSLGYTKRRLLMPFPCNSCTSLSFLIILLVIWVATAQNPAPTSTKYSGTHRITKICSKTVKLFVIAPSHIIPGRRWCEATMIGRKLSLSFLLDVNMTFQNQHFALQGI